MFTTLWTWSMPSTRSCSPGRVRVSTNRFHKALYRISLISVLLPEPDAPFPATGEPSGIVTSRLLRLFSRAPRTVSTLPLPLRRRKGNGNVLTVRGARENNLKSLDVTIPLGSPVAGNGASGSGKSTLISEILYKALWKRLVDTRTLPGEHDRVDGMDHVHKVVNIDQSPIGRNSRSNPATYIGFYDTIRDLFTQAPLSVERGYKAGRFSFNVKGGRCEECQGEGVITTQLYFMPDVEVTCGACKGARFNAETLDVTLRGKTIDDVLVDR